MEVFYKNRIIKRKIQKKLAVSGGLNESASDDSIRQAEQQKSEIYKNMIEITVYGSQLVAKEKMIMQ